MLRFINTKISNKNMKEIAVTRSGQITLTKEIREKLDIKVGDTIILNTIGKTVIITKKDSSVFEKGHFLPDNFADILEKIRKAQVTHQLK